MNCFGTTFLSGGGGFSAVCNGFFWVVSNENIPCYVCGVSNRAIEVLPKTLLLIFLNQFQQALQKAFGKEYIILNMLIPFWRVLGLAVE